MDDDAFLASVAASLAGLDGVRAVALGGPRAQGTARPDSDWDFAVYDRGSFDPQQLRDLGWPGEVSEIGGWGGGVFNGGAWLTIGDRSVDVHYRDLATVEHEIAQAEAGRVHIEPLLFHLAGIPTYLLLAELAVNRVLHGELPRPGYPEALRRAAPREWWGRADALFGYARAGFAAHGRLAQTLGMTAQATTCAAHAVMAAHGEWVTNEKTLLERAGLRDAVDERMRDTADPVALVDDIRSLCAAAVEAS
ncbi:hypothetical protein CLV46_2981 [Diaminobutyricimonas aerilata]|uniref:Nucleotidyltransferase-like protein n=1 Tax=Diaminobutyricimonas aerilata TaxID=1162967 RepID=A0A2M9CNH4_9MICO|nr:nucleotidyltransferase domain-containing protein [Diaminobutyricimonas aerilata]PJJ73394.1 hypothetical protein CLV46_2981 [Diaminobutyricimonas aerilata]